MQKNVKVHIFCEQNSVDIKDFYFVSGHPLNDHLSGTDINNQTL